MLIMLLLLKHVLRLMNQLLLLRKIFMLISCYIRMMLFQVKFSTFSCINFLSNLKNILTAMIITDHIFKKKWHDIC